MVSMRLVVAGLFLGLAQAQSSEQSSITSAPSSAASADASASSTEGPRTHTVAVGANAHRFTRDEITADVGDTVVFSFYPSNHSVIRAEFGFPCIPYEMHGIGRQGFYSGFYPVNAITNEPPQWSMTINTTEPIFYYCGAEGSCYHHKMIGVINPNDTQTLDEHLEAAEGLTFQVLPGEPYPDEEGPLTPSSTPTGGADSDSSENGSGSGSESGGGGSDLSGGAIAGIVIGAVAFLAIVAGLIFFIGRRRGLQKSNRRDTMVTQAPPVSEAHYSMGPRSPGMDSRWSQWKPGSTEPYHDGPVSPGMVPYSNSPGSVPAHPNSQYGYVDAQHTGLSQQTGYMNDGSSHPGSPPPNGMGYSERIQSPVPVELPSETAEMPAGDSQRYSWSDQRNESNFQSPGGPRS